MPTPIRPRIAYLLSTAISTRSQIFTGCLEVVITTKFTGVITASHRSASKWTSRYHQRRWTLTATSNLRPSSRKLRRAWRSPTSKCPGPAHWCLRHQLWRSWGRHKCESAHSTSWGCQPPIWSWQEVVEQDDQEWELCSLKLALEAIYIHKVGTSNKNR